MFGQNIPDRLIEGFFLGGALFIGVVIIWAPLLYMVRHNWPDFAKGPYILTAMVGLPLLLARIDDGSGLLRAFVLGLCSLPLVIGLSMLVSLISWTIENVFAA